MSVIDGVKWRLARLRLRAQGVVVKGAVGIDGLLPLVGCDGEIVLEEGVSFLCRQGPRIVLRSATGALLKIGRCSFINQSATIIATKGITIGSHAKIGPHVVIHDTAYHEVDQGAGTRQAAITIGNNVWIGRGAAILPGISIGDHSVVGAGSIVTAPIPAKTVVAGNPARIIREVAAEDNYVRA